jgi:hypothetical protein
MIIMFKTHPSKLFPGVGYIVAKLSMTPESVVRLTESYVWTDIFAGHWRYGFSFSCPT